MLKNKKKTKNIIFVEIDPQVLKFLNIKICIDKQVFSFQKQ